MAYQILPNIIFIFSVLGILLIILRRLPEAVAKHEEPSGVPGVEIRLIKRGLPAQTISKVRVIFVMTTQRIWNFILEAKDLKPHAVAGYKMKKIITAKLSMFKRSEAAQTLHDAKDEQYYLDVIKAEPKNLSHYDALGKFYLEEDNASDAKDIYQYLANHQPVNPEYQARLAFCLYHSKNYEQAAAAYQKSIALDSTQPNRYYNLSLSLQAAGNRHGATDAIKKALELEPQNPKFLKALEKINKN